MKKTFTFVLTLILGGVSAWSQELPYWQNTQVSSVNAQTRRTEVIYYADRADAATAKLIANDMGTNAASEDMIYVGQTQASADWYCSVMRLLPMEKEADSFRETMGDAYDEYMSFARNKELVLSGFQKN